MGATRSRLGVVLEQPGEQLDELAAFGRRQRGEQPRPAVARSSAGRSPHSRRVKRTDRAMDDSGDVAAAFKTGLRILGGWPDGSLASLRVGVRRALGDDIHAVALERRGHGRVVRRLETVGNLARAGDRDAELLEEAFEGRRLMDE
jgi:hypothetical protein